MPMSSIVSLARCYYWLRESVHAYGSMTQRSNAEVCELRGSNTSTETLSL